MLLAPAVIYLVIFKYWPMYGVQIAFRNYNPIDGFMGSEWVGLEHIARFLHSFQFSRIFINTIAINVLGLVFGFPVPIVLALLINQLASRRLRSFIQTVLFSPAFISTVVVVGMLFVLLSPRSGLVNNVISLAGGTPINFMNEEGWFRPIYVLSDIWQNAGFSMIIYLAALAAIDPSLHEAARVDGANRWQRLWHIDLPGIRPIISIMLILAVGNLLNIGFEKALLMQTDLNLGASQIIQTLSTGVTSSMIPTPSITASLRSLLEKLSLGIPRKECYWKLSTKLWNLPVISDLVVHNAQVYNRP